MTETPDYLTQALREFRQEFSIGEYVEYTGKAMGALRMKHKLALRGWIVSIRLDLWGQNMYRAHWEDMPDGAIESDDIHPDLLKPVVIEEE